MRPHPDPMQNQAEETDRCACAVAHPETPDAGDASGPDIRPELVERCKALIADGIYETEDRIQAAIDRLTAALD